ncbi:MAG: hypothetical protein V2A79_13565 [Planctomycetota bacterium]
MQRSKFWYNVRALSGLLAIGFLVAVGCQQGGGGHGGSQCVRAGGDCNSNGDCCSGLSCNAGQCEAECVAAGGDCTQSADCCTDLTCGSAQTCVTPSGGDAKRDLWSTDTKSASQQDFSSSPVPAGLLGDDCESFAGAASFAGQAISENSTGMADTIVHRSGDPIEPSDPVGTIGTVEVQITNLNLWSTAPITVMCGGQSTQWNVHATLSDTPSPEGTLTATKTHSNGGTAQTVLPVLMKLIFTNASDASVQRELDFADEGLDPIQFQADLAWVHALDPAHPDPENTFILGVAGGPEAAKLIARGGVDLRRARDGGQVIAWSKPCDPDALACSDVNTNGMNPNGVTLIACSEHGSFGGSHVHNTCIVDTDGDGIPDGSDNCRYDFNPDQEDRDGDQFGDVCDPCPDDPTCPMSGGECEGQCTDLYHQQLDLWVDEWGPAMCAWYADCAGSTMSLTMHCQQLLSEEMAAVQEMMCLWTQFRYWGCDRCVLDETPTPTLPCDIPGVTNNPCANVTCPQGQICDSTSGECVADQCQNVTCPQGQTCEPYSGMCWDRCQSVSCPEGRSCDPESGECCDATMGNCAPPPIDLCESVTCPVGMTCSAATGVCWNSQTGECAPMFPDPCADVTCSEGQTCVWGVCCDSSTGDCGYDVDLCGSVTCPDDMTCDPQTGRCCDAAGDCTSTFCLGAICPSGTTCNSDNYQCCDAGNQCQSPEGYDYCVLGNVTCPAGQTCAPQTGMCH